MPKYIDADKIPYIVSTDGSTPKIALYSDIVVIPAADVVEVKHGEWLETKEWYFDEYAQSEYQRKCYECSVCKRTELYEEPYCHCGAKMDGRRCN